MADFTIIRSRTHRIRDGYVYEGVAAFNSTDLTGTLPIHSAQKVRNVFVQACGAAPTASTQYLQSSVGTVSASAKFTQFASAAGVISAADFTVTTTVTATTTNVWSVGVINKTQTLTISDITAGDKGGNDSSTTPAGTDFTAYTPHALTLTAAANLVVAAGDVLEWTFTKASSAANLVGLGLRTTVALTGATSQEYVYPPAPNATSGFFLLTSGKLTIGREASSPTSGLKFQFRVEYQ